MLPSPNAPGGVAKSAKVYVPDGAPAGHTKLKKFGTVSGGSPAGIDILWIRGGNVCGPAELQGRKVENPGPKNTSATPLAHPRLAAPSAGATMTKSRSRTAAPPGVA